MDSVIIILSCIAVVAAILLIVSFVKEKLDSKIEFFPNKKAEIIFENGVHDTFSEIIGINCSMGWVEIETMSRTYLYKQDDIKFIAYWFDGAED